MIAIAVANRPVSRVEIMAIAGRSDEDVDGGLNELLKWRLINRLAGDLDEPSFAINQNTKRLVEKTFSRDSRLPAFKQALANIAGERSYGPMQKRVGGIISTAKSHVLRGDYDRAADHIRANLTGDLVNSADLWGTLGWVLSRSASNEPDAAREAFKRAHELNTRKEDTYYHWSQMEIRLAEALNQQPQFAAEQWGEAAQIAEMGLDLLNGDTQALCWQSGYARSRQAKCYLALDSFASATGSFSRSRQLLLRGLEADPSSVRDIERGQLLRALVIAQEGLDDWDGVAETMSEWAEHSDQSSDWRTERERLVRDHPELSSRL